MILFYKNYYFIMVLCLSDLIKVILSESETTSPKSERTKRFLIVPQTSPTRHQLIVGVGIPVELEKESCTVGLVIKAQYYMPTNIEDLKPDYFWPDRVEPVVTQFKKRSTLENEITVNETGRYATNKITGNRVETYQVEAVQIDEKPIENSNHLVENKAHNDKSTSNQNIQNSRWMVYKGIEGILEHNGMTGRPCLLRCICEAAQSRFNHENGILGELVNTILA